MWIIIEGSASFGAVLYLEEVPSESPFVFRASKDYDGSPLAFDFVFIDLYGNTWEDRIVVSGPLTPPAGLTGEAGVDDVQLFWDPHPGPGLAGYHVYRSDSEGGPYARADHELIRAASYFHDTGLSGATFYYYIVPAVDESGRESAPGGELAIQTTIEAQQGWPIGVGGEVSSPLVLDLDGDGDLEVIFGAGDAKIYAFHHGGEEVLDIDQNPTTISGFAVAVGTVGTPSAGDIDGDGSLEIVAVANSGSTHQVYAWRAYDGPDEDHEADLVEGWPVSTSDRIGAVSVPALADVDGDGTLEIFVGGDHKFYGWRHDGTGIVSPDGVFLDPGSWIYGTPALGDLSGDGVPDVVIGGGDDGILYALDGEANDLPGLWPVTLGGSLTSSPAMGDLDGDGSLEVVVASMADKVHVLQADGTPFGHFWPAPVPQNQSYSVCSSVSLGDLDGDGTLEVVVGSSDKKVYAWAWDGSPLDGWPTGETDDEIVASPALGDLDGDGAMEVVVSTSGHLIYAWRLWDLDMDGAADVVPGWPINMGGAGTSPAIVDLDGDGDVEVASGSVDSMMFFWDCAGPYDPLATGWGQFHHDPMRTGFHP